MFGLGTPEIILILVIALIIFGPRKLPEIGEAIGKSIKGFKKSVKSIENDVAVYDSSEKTKNEDVSQSLENEIEEQKETVGSKD